MKKITKMLAFASLASFAILSGCSEAEEPDPTKAELCGAGLSQECLIGTWTFDGVMSKEQKTLITGFDYTATPGYMEFYIDKDSRTGAKTPMFKLSLSPNDVNYSLSDCNPAEGSFEVMGPTVKLSFTRGNVCIGKKTLSFDPTITNNGTKIQMDVGRVWLMGNQVTSTLGIKEESLNFYTEVYSINANATK